MGLGLGGMGTDSHQVLAATLSFLTSIRGWQIMPTLYWCPYQVLKATGAPGMINKHPQRVTTFVWRQCKRMKNLGVYEVRGVGTHESVGQLDLFNLSWHRIQNPTKCQILSWPQKVSKFHRLYLSRQKDLITFFPKFRGALTSPVFPVPPALT